jgi:hypothetical protein
MDGFSGTWGPPKTIMAVGEVVIRGGIALYAGDDGFVEG